MKRSNAHVLQHHHKCTSRACSGGTRLHLRAWCSKTHAVAHALCAQGYYYGTMVNVPPTSAAAEVGGPLPHSWATGRCTANQLAPRYVYTSDNTGDL